MGAIRVNAEAGIRFEFAENWVRFLEASTEERIHAAERGLSTTLEMFDMRGKTFRDMGSGSGLSSLAARRLGARVLRSTLIGDPLRARRSLGGVILRVMRSGPWIGVRRGLPDRLGQFDIACS